jgi:hypothetical protein
MHWWFYMPNISEHYTTCSLQHGRSECICPHCKTGRFVKDKNGIHGVERCWFFFDCLQTKALDPQWASVVLRTQASRDDRKCHAPKPSFAEEPALEYNRVLQHLPDGTSRENVRPSLRMLRHVVPILA